MVYVTCAPVAFLKGIASQGGLSLWLECAVRTLVPKPQNIEYWGARRPVMVGLAWLCKAVQDRVLPSVEEVTNSPMCVRISCLMGLLLASAAFEIPDRVEG
jgi:hypothetical protein